MAGATTLAMFNSMADPILVVIMVGLLILGLVYLQQSHQKRKKAFSRLPPGSMGWPFFGNAFSLRRRHPANSLSKFMEENISRYGKIFTTRVFGSLTVISADPELNRFAFQNEMRLFVNTWPAHYTKLLGESSLILSLGDIHKQKRSTVLNFLSSRKVQQLYFEDVERIASTIVSSWQSRPVIQASDEAKKFSFNILVKKMLGLDMDDPETERLSREFVAFYKGFYTLPFHLPFSAYRRALQATGRIKKCIERRMEEKMREEDILGWLMKNTSLSRNEIGCTIRGLIATGFDSTPRALTLAIYFLEGCPKAIQQLREEHQELIRSKKLCGQSVLTWDDYKNLEFIQCVINEAQRVGSAGTFLRKTAIEDVEFKGYVIPRGTHVLTHFGAVHLDPSFFEDPEHFNPWRWLGPSGVMKSNEFMPFGGGVRYCPAAELARMMLTVFLHHLILNYNWELVGNDPPIATPQPVFLNGLPIKLKAVPRESVST